MFLPSSTSVDPGGLESVSFLFFCASSMVINFSTPYPTLLSTWKPENHCDRSTINQVTELGARRIGSRLIRPTKCRRSIYQLAGNHAVRNSYSCTSSPLFRRYPPSPRSTSTTSCSDARIRQATVRMVEPLADFLRRRRNGRITRYTSRRRPGESGRLRIW
jgi:hypothetical protein